MKPQTPQRTTAGLIGDYLAGKPVGKAFSFPDLANLLSRDRAAIGRAAADLVAAGALTSELDPKDARKRLVSMTAQQQASWRADNGASVAAAGVNLDLLSNAERGAMAAAVPRKQVKVPDLRFGMWADGALVIEGLARKQVTLPAADTKALATLFSSFPEGALQALCDSPLKPSFTLHIDGREYPMSGEQTAALVAYIEQLPNRALRGAAPAAGDAPRTTWVTGLGK